MTSSEGTGGSTPKDSGFLARLIRRAMDTTGSGSPRDAESIPQNPYEGAGYAISEGDEDDAPVVSIVVPTFASSGWSQGDSSLAPVVEPMMPPRAGSTDSSDSSTSSTDEIPLEGSRSHTGGGSMPQLHHFLGGSEVDVFSSDFRSPNLLPRIPEEEGEGEGTEKQERGPNGEPVPRVLWVRPTEALESIALDYGNQDSDDLPEMPAASQMHPPGMDQSRDGNLANTASEQTATGGSRSPEIYPNLAETGSHGSFSPMIRGMVGASPMSSPFSSRASSEMYTPVHPTLDEYKALKDPYSKAMLEMPPCDVSITPEHLQIPFRLSPLFHYRMMQLICLLSAGTGFIYLGWKVVTIFKYASRTNPAGFLLLASEILLYGCSLVLWLELSKPPRDREPAMLPASGPFPTVAIFVCCCKEPLEIIADTVRGAMAQHYPPSRFSVWILDDGGDDKLQDWAKAEALERYGTDRLKYVRREKRKGMPHFFKAGNINNGLTLIDEETEFVAILDADMIPSRMFLTAMISHFTSTDVAFVQCPQSFYNLVRGDPLNDSSQDFYDVMLPYRDGRDSAQCIGTGVVFRVSALRENGGFSVGSITEDSDTSLSLHSKGYKSVFVDQRLQAGLAAWNLEGYVKQRQRWATGNLQILLHRKPLLIRDRRFSLYRRIVYWFSGFQYYMNFVVLLTLILPLVILFFDLPIMPRVSRMTFVRLPYLSHTISVSRLYVLLLVPFALLSRLLCLGMFSRLPDAMRVQLRGDQTWFWMSFYNVQAILKFMFPLLSRKFEATGAGKAKSSGILATIWSLRIVWFHVSFCCAALFAVLWSFIHLNFHDCGKLLKVSAWSSYVLFTVQSMAVPIWHVLLTRLHPKPADRRSMLQYDEAGVPYLALNQIMPKKDWRLAFYTIIPLLWGAVMVFSMVAAIVNYRPQFCTVSGFFDYPRF